MKRLFTMIVLVLVLTGFSTGIEAGVKKIRPAQLKNFDSSDTFIQSPQYVSSADATACNFTAMVKFPVGKRITRLKYYHKGATAANYTGVALYRIKMGEEPDEISVADCTDHTVSVIIAVEDETIDFPIIKSGYTYYIQVASHNIGSKVYGIKIFYK